MAGDAFSMGVEVMIASVARGGVNFDVAAAKSVCVLDAHGLDASECFQVKAVFCIIAGCYYLGTGTGAGEMVGTREGIPAGPLSL